jgi:hypothetical protein
MMNKPKLRFPGAVQAWGSPEFAERLKQEIEELDATRLPLQQGLATGSHAVDDKLEAMIIGVSGGDGLIHVRAGLFYSGIIAGCSCADDPTPVDEQSEYCEVQFEINTMTAEATVQLLRD